MSLQQLFGWRRQLREEVVSHSEADERSFVPTVTMPCREHSLVRRKAKVDSRIMEIEIRCRRDDASLFLLAVIYSVLGV